MAHHITMQINVPADFVAWIETALRQQSPQHLPIAPEFVMQALVDHICSAPLPPALAQTIISQGVAAYGNALANFSHQHVTSGRRAAPRPR